MSHFVTPAGMFQVWSGTASLGPTGLSVTIHQRDEMGGRDEEWYARGRAILEYFKKSQSKLSSRVLRALMYSDLTIDEIIHAASHDPEKLLRVRNFGAKSLAELIRVIASNNAADYAI